jgi:hypothetical protein
VPVKDLGHGYGSGEAGALDRPNTEHHSGDPSHMPHLRRPVTGDELKRGRADGLQSEGRERAGQAAAGENRARLQCLVHG